MSFVTPQQPMRIRYPSAPARVTRVLVGEVFILQENFLAAMASAGDDTAIPFTPIKPSGTQVPGAPSRVSRPLVLSLTSSPPRLLNF